MIGTAPRMSIWAVLAACAGLALSACGTSGNAGINQSVMPPVLAAAVQGTVYAPNGQFAAAERRWWSWTDQLQLVPQAYASLDDEMPSQTVVDVSLSALDALDAAHGSTANARLLNQAPTDDSGNFEIIDDQYLTLLTDQSHLMVQVGTPGDTLTRSFVLRHSTNNIDAVTEAVVRVVLVRLTQAPVAQLDSFSIADLTAIDAAARTAATNASGSTVSEFNQSAYDLVSSNSAVQQALANATGS